MNRVFHLLQSKITVYYLWNTLLSRDKFPPQCREGVSAPIYLQKRIELSLSIYLTVHISIISKTIYMLHVTFEITVQ
jgi:hypothetical protein